MSEPSLPTSGTPLAFFDPGSVCLRTSQGTLLSEAPELLQRLPNWGTTVDGVLYEHQTPERLTAARDGSASLATPTAWLGSCPARAIGDAERWHNPERSNELSDQMAVLPTPVVNDMGANKTVEWWDAWAPNQKAADGRPAPHGKSLSIEVQRLLPTPRAQNGEPRNMKPWVRPLDQPQNLENAIARLLLTLRAQNGEETGENQKK